MTILKPCTSPHHRSHWDSTVYLECVHSRFMPVNRGTAAAVFMQALLDNMQMHYISHCALIRTLERKSVRAQVKTMNLLRNLFEGRSQAVQEALAWWNAAGGPSVPAVVAQTLHRCGDTPGGSRLAEQALHVASNIAASAHVSCPWQSFFA